LGGDKGRLIAAEEKHGRRDVIWFTQSAQKRAADGGFDDLRR